MKDILSLIPYEVNDYVKRLIEGQDLTIRTVPERRTKHGDYRKFNNKHIIKTEQKNYLQNIYNDSIGFAGAKIIRRIFGFAHNIDFDWIRDDNIRAICEHKCANLGIEMQINPSKFKGISSLIEEAIKLDNDSISF